MKHWADGGETSLRNGVLLCAHHRAVHEGGVRVCLDVKGQVVFFTPRGKALPGAPPATAGMEASPATVGLGAIEPFAGAPRWKRDGAIPWAEEARVWEALDSG